MNYLIVFLGAGIGGAARHGVNVVASRAALAAQLPYGTLTVNVLGSFAMGLLAEYFALKGHLPQPWRLFLTTGVPRRLHHFSAFSLDAALLYERGEPGAAAAYAFGSVVLSIAALFVGLAMVRNLVIT